MMRKLNKIIIHCSDHPDSYDYVDAEFIRRDHVAPKPPKGKGKGYDDIGYHFVIKRDGSIQGGRPLETPGAHCIGHNSDSIGICLVGRTVFTKEQYDSLNQLVKTYSEEYKISEVEGHRHYDKSKTCPNFDVATELGRYHECTNDCLDCYKNWRCNRKVQG